MRLTRNFMLSEFATSETATQLGIVNRVPSHLIENVRRVAEMLQRVRDFLGAPIIITSGYRHPELNRAVNGNIDSHHLSGQAADWICPEFGEPLEVALAIEPFMSMWGMRQLIHEHGEWLHTGIAPVAPVNRVLTRDRGIPPYRPGLHPPRSAP
jgi:zinc D-Ala-D-Ala carboxypeptidase